MPTSYRYAERVTPFAGDPLDVVTNLVSSGVFDSYVVVERDGRFSVAGDVLAEVRSERAGLRLTLDGSTTTRPCDGTLGQVVDALRSLPVADWRAYGWVAFEAAYPPLGQSVGDEPLAHVVVPRCEVILDGGRAVVRGIDPGTIAEVVDVLATPVQSTMDDTAVVGVDISHGRDHYRAAVAAAVAEIRSGALQKAIVSRVVPVRGPVDLPRTYARGRRGNTPVRSFLLDLGGVRAAGFSPEIVCESDGVTVVTQPLAGTRALQEDEALNRRLRAELETDPKEIFEHAVSVKAAIDDLRDVCTPGSVRVEGFLGVQERGSVQHLGSAVRGDLAANRDAWDALQSVFPAVTVSGIPKAAAYETIRRLESGPRGLYAGAVLVADSRGTLDATLVLRTVFQAGGRTWLRAGAGIVAASTPDREYEETCEKLRSVSRFLVPLATPAPDGALAGLAAEVTS
ncbi:salicylate synthase [Kutzneria kofuensis]|uniref:Salicylate synthase n=1 Tax=Kutzneria kofuensis TaxID=103725 RepID=A0A7W9KQY0_9PSEU|nr:salicylate synthase [Kutzneria kofuensis]MBB5896808.1 salicylate synthase [Kutzneria kofuensis]